MRRLLPAPHRLALHLTASSREIEAHAQARLPAHALMARAGAALAKLAIAVAPHARRIWIACGPGNNGGDGLVAARLLHAHGHQVQVSLIPARSDAQPTDAAWALTQARAEGVPIGTELPGFRPDLVIDALLGLGSTRAPDGTMAQWIAAMNSMDVPVLAVDLPTGLASDSGRLLGAAAVRASHTLALLTLKPGLFTAQGRAQSGTLWFDDLGVLPDCGADAWLLGSDSLDAGRSQPSHAAHKGSQGDVLVIGGAAGMQGATRLAARAALAAGAGRVYACLLDEHAGADTQRAEIMHWPLARLADVGAWQDQCVVAGCGGGTAIAAQLPALLRHAARLVLDADALNAIAADAALRGLLQARRSQGLATVLTPHPLEAARLLDQASGAEVQADRLAAAAALAGRYGCTVILKGSGSVIASPELPPAINSSGSAALATAGTGDVLAGWLGGLWAQQPARSAHELACAAAYWHGLAGETQQAGPLRAADLIERMHALHGRPAL